MAVYAVGDIHGCFKPFQRLLDRVAFDPEEDQLWCVGDLINRGPSSLRTLRFLYQHRRSVITVLGNHDLHALAMFYTNKKLKKSDTIADLLKADDAEELIDWLRRQPLVYYNKLFKTVLVHAGIPPIWGLQEALDYSQEVERVLQDDELITPFLEHMYSSDPVRWDNSMQGTERLRNITNYVTRMRFCRPDGTIEFESKDGVDGAPKGFVPWFELPNSKMQGYTIIFGHWAALSGQCYIPNIYALDGGCVWGNSLVMMNVETKERFYCPCE